MCLGVCYFHTKREPSVGSWLVGLIAEPAHFGQGADVVFGVIGPGKGFITIAWSLQVRRRWYRERKGHQHRHKQSKSSLHICLLVLLSRLSVPTPLRTLHLSHLT